MDEDQRDSGVGESTITVKWWCVLVVIISIFGFMFVASANQDRRITTLETQFTYITKSIDEVRDISKEIRQDQIQRFNKHKGNN